MLFKKREIYIPFPYAFNVKYTVHLINYLLVFPNDQDLKFTSFDVTRLYSNIHKNEFKKSLNKCATNMTLMKN